MNTNFKDSGIAWIGQIPKHWEVKKIKYCLKENFSGCWGDDLENEQISHNSRLCIRVADFDFDKQKVKQTADTFRNYTKSQILSTKLQDGDLIIEKSGGGDKMPVGRSVVFEQNLFGVKEVLFANFCQCFRPLNINNKFFAHTMKAFYQNNNMRFFFNQTTGIQNLSIFNIVNAFLPYPPLNEQKKIAEFLDKKCEIIDKRLENLEQKIKSLKEYKKSLISECVTKGINSKNMEFKDSRIPWIGQIPKHWEISKIKYYFNFSSGLNITKENLIESGIPVISYGQIHSKENTGTFIKDSFFRFISQDYLKNKKSLVNKGNFIFADTSEDLDGAGNSVFVDLDLIMFAGYHTIILKNKCNFEFSKFLSYLFQTDLWRSQIRLAVSGVKVFSITKKILANCEILVPPLNEQKEIAEFLDKKCEKIDRLNENYTKQITALKEYKKSLIYECVTGKKEI
ncbi:restriction endonuclease subunit S [Campylobacter sp. CX2-8023-23]|uniref:restriction endonuclease subunit S n=1 Tax=Campylobacter porcelli TaxID=1660073 RepID=UPI002ECA1968|nr:restriction endonuclease subunit S [Campylobacter sp. CX2-8023-23]